MSKNEINLVKMLRPSSRLASGYRLLNWRHFQKWQEASFFVRNHLHTEIYQT